MVMALRVVLAATLPVAAQTGPDLSSAAAQSADRVDDMADVAPLSAGVIALLGKPIVRLDVTADGFGGEETLTLRTVRVGERLTGEVARRAGRELLEGGAYAEVRVEAVESSGQVVLRVRAVVRRLVASIRVEAGVLDDEAMLQEAHIAVGEELTPALLTTMRDRARAYYVRHGYSNASVGIDPRQTDDPMQIGLVVRVQANAPRKIARRILVHDGPVIVDATIDPTLDEVERGYSVEAGDRVDEDTIGTADRSLSDGLRSRGYFQAEVTHQTLDSAGRTYLYVRIQTGPKYVLRFEGLNSLDRDEIEQALDLDHKPSRSTVHLASKIAEFYRKHGFLDVRVEGEERGGPNDAIHVLFFRVRENHQVRVARRE